MRTAPKGANFLWVNRTLRTRGKFYGKLKKNSWTKVIFLFKLFILRLFCKIYRQKKVVKFRNFCKNC